MTFQSLIELLTAIVEDDCNPSRERYRLHQLVNGTWFAFTAKPASMSHWAQTKPDAQTGNAMSLNRALNRILQDVRDNWIDDELDHIEAKRLIQSYKLIKVEVESC